MAQAILLKIEGGLTFLSGFDYGLECFDKFVRDEYEKTKYVEVEIPDCIKRIGISFVQGFISRVAADFGVSNVKRHIRIVSVNPDLVKKFERSIMVYKNV